MTKALPKAAMLGGAALLLAACTSVRTTSPTRSAQEELLISIAADRAAESLALQVPPHLKIWIDTAQFGTQDNQYGIATIEDQLLRRGDYLVEDKAKADAIVLIRTGVLSTDERSSLVGLPQVPVPFYPVGNYLTVPELDVFKETRLKGVARFAASVYDRKTGKLIVSTDPQWGYSHRHEWGVLLVFSWARDDINQGHPPKKAQRQ